MARILGRPEHLENTTCHIHAFITPGLYAKAAKGSSPIATCQFASYSQLVLAGFTQRSELTFRALGVRGPPPPGPVASNGDSSEGAYGVFPPAQAPPPLTGAARTCISVGVGFGVGGWGQG